MAIETIWNDTPKKDLLNDLKSFCKSLDYYSIAFEIDSDSGKYLALSNGSYELSEDEPVESFQCPNCSAKQFDCVEGILESKPVLGLACLSCETYGIVFPDGL